MTSLYLLELNEPDFLISIRHLGKTLHELLMSQIHIEK